MRKKNIKIYIHTHICMYISVATKHHKKLPSIKQAVILQYFLIDLSFHLLTTVNHWQVNLQSLLQAEIYTFKKSVPEISLLPKTGEETKFFVCKQWCLWGWSGFRPNSELPEFETGNLATQWAWSQRESLGKLIQNRSNCLQLKIPTCTHLLSQEHRLLGQTKALLSQPITLTILVLCGSSWVGVLSQSSCSQTDLPDLMVRDLILP